MERLSTVRKDKIVWLNANPTCSTSATNDCANEFGILFKDWFDTVKISPLLYPFPLFVTVIDTTNPFKILKVALALFSPPILPITALFVLPTILPSKSLHFVWSAKINSTSVIFALPLLAYWPPLFKVLIVPIPVSEILLSKTGALNFTFW